MARLISPPRAEHGRLRTPLTAGECRVLDFFDRHLADGWEIYVQPFLNGLRPDFVLLHPHAGIAVFEVKDWDLHAGGYHLRLEREGVTLWCRDGSGREFRVKDEPVGKVERYKQEVLSLYCPRLGIQLDRYPQIRSAVTAGVIFSVASTERSKQLLGPVRESLGISGPSEPYYPMAGRDALEAGDLGAVFPEGFRGTSRWMTPQLANDLRTWLVEPDIAVAQRDPLPLDARQRELATTRTATGYRRVRGPAGAGKSLALAARAAHQSAEGKQVLVVTFNLTLPHYLRDLAVRYPDPRKSVIDRITWLHFHGWCKARAEETRLVPAPRASRRETPAPKSAIRPGRRCPGTASTTPPGGLTVRSLR